MKITYWIAGLPSTAAQPNNMLRLESGRQIEIGRADTNAIRFADDTVSRKHALLTMGADGAWYVYDLNSQNGTYVNGTQISAGTRLQPDDVIRLGPSGPSLRFLQRTEIAARTPPVPRVRPVPPAPPAPHAFPGGALGRRPGTSPGIGLSTVLPPFSRGHLRPLQRRHAVLGLIAIVPMTLLAMLSAAGAAPWVGYANLAIVVFFFVTSSSTALLEVAGRSKPWFSIAAAGVVTAFLSFILLAVDFGKEEPFRAALIVHSAIQQFIAAIPILAGVWIGQRGAQPWRQRLGVYGPLDGLSIGLGSAAGVELVESLTRVELLESLTPQSLNSVIGPLIGDIAGQLALSGYFGCLLGLSVARPKSRFALFLCAWIVTTTLSVISESLLRLGTLYVALSAVVFFVIFALLITSIYRARVVEGLSQPLSSVLGKVS